MKYRHIGYIFLAGVILFIPGVIFTYLNYPLSSEMLIVGSIIKVVAALMFIVKMVKERNKKRILDE